MEENEQRTFERVLVYDQKDRQYSEHHEAFFDCFSAIWAFSWSLPGMTHPITTRARVLIVEESDSELFSPISASIDVWKDHVWHAIDEVFVLDTQFSSRKHIELEALCRIEAFLLGINIDQVREKYGDVVEEEQEETEQEKHSEEDNPNVITFLPPKS